MRITDTLNGRTVEDVRRNPDGSVTLYCDSGHEVCLFVCDNRIEVKPPRLYLPDQPFVEPDSQRMRLMEAFQGFMINYVHYDEGGNLIFVCEPMRHDRDPYKKALGHREIKVAHSHGLIDELPPVSAVMTLPSLSIFGKQ